MSELLPCPFCGGEAEAVHEIDGFWTVECVKCGALVDGIESWNTRAERTCQNVDDHKTVWFICSVCGYQQKLSHTRSYCPNCGAKVKEGCNQ